MEINRNDCESCNATSIKINNITLDLDNRETIETNDTKYDHEKVVVELSDEKLMKLKEYETELNEYLTKNGFDKVALLHGKSINAKKAKSTSRDQLN